MSDHPHPREAESLPQSADIVTVLRKMQQQLEFLERKIDTLIKQSEEKSFRPKSFGDKPYGNKPYGDQRFSKPFRSFDRGPRRDREESDRGPRERDFEERRPFNKGSFQKNEGFDKRPFQKREGESSSGFAGKKKKFFHRGRNRD